MSQSTNDVATNKVLSIVAHLAALFTSLLASILVPVVILAITEDPVVKANARASINFQLSLIIWALIAFVLSFVGVGIIMFFVLGIWSIVAPIIAMISVANEPSKPYHYSLAFDFV